MRVTAILMTVALLAAAPAAAQTSIPEEHPYGLDPYKPSDAAILRTWGSTLVAQTPLLELRHLDPYKPSHAALLEAYRSQSCVITPHPRAHALYADKRRLVTLSDPEALLTLGALPEDAALLGRHVPRTRLVEESDRERLWQGRKELFFKPHSGYGGKAAYRGDKLTRKVFADILEGDYVAQALVPPSERLLKSSDTSQALKMDLRNYVYSGEVQLVAARLYQGQTTNFRTPGGGFAPVFYPPG